MGDISEMIQDGILCDDCGGFVGAAKINANGGLVNGDKILKAPGHPITCNDCKREIKHFKFLERQAKKNQPKAKGG